MRIQTGKGTISLMTLLAVWSISLVVNLPGLAISPMLGNLDKIFPGTSELEIQLLTVLPNLLIIPFVLFSGKLAEKSDPVLIVMAGLVIYLAAGVLYLLANSMLALILISCLLGVGCGLVIPLAAGLLADLFVGKYRMQQLGIKSGISNFALVVATFVVGWLNHGNWRLPFIVYLMPAIPLVLVWALRKKRPDTDKDIEENKLDNKSVAQEAQPQWAKAKPGDKVKGGFILSRIWGLAGFYFFATYAVIIVTDYLPFLIQEHHMDTELTGTITSLFFFAMFIPGVTLPYVCRVFKTFTVPAAGVIIACGLALMILAHNDFLLCLAGLLMGFGYGVCQPIIYDKATYTVTCERKSTLALAIVLAVNYVSIALTPYIVDAFHLVFDKSNPNTFAFALNFFLVLGFAVLAFVNRNRFSFHITPDLK